MANGLKASSCNPLRVDKIQRFTTPIGDANAIRRIQLKITLVWRWITEASYAYIAFTLVTLRTTWNSILSNTCMQLSSYGFLTANMRSTGPIKAQTSVPLSYEIRKKEKSIINTKFLLMSNLLNFEVLKTYQIWSKNKSEKKAQQMHTAAINMQTKKKERTIFQIQLQYCASK